MSPLETKTRETISKAAKELATKLTTVEPTYEMFSEEFGSEARRIDRKKTDADFVAKHTSYARGSNRFATFTPHITTHTKLSASILVGPAPKRKKYSRRRFSRGRVRRH